MEVFTQLYKPVPLYLVKYLNVLLHASDIFCVMSPFSSLSFKYLNCGFVCLFTAIFLPYKVSVVYTSNQLYKWFCPQIFSLWCWQVGYYIYRFCFLFFFVMAFIPPIIFLLVGFSSPVKIFFILFILYFPPLLPIYIDCIKNRVQLYKYIPMCCER